MNAYHGPPMTLGNAAAARVRLIVWCLDCRHQVEPDPAEMAERYGANLAVASARRNAECSSTERRCSHVLTSRVQAAPTLSRREPLVAVSRVSTTLCRRPVPLVVPFTPLRQGWGSAEVRR
jgi:hypothetical protein